MLYYEQKFKKRGYNFIIGVDEAGRGPLAGPVVAAAVFLKKTHFQNRIDDSKKLTPQQREKAFPEIIHNSIFGIGMVNAEFIDRFNILVATRIAMEEAIETLLAKLRNYKKRRIHILVDGNVKLNLRLEVTNIIHGDSRSISIACASIIAKVSRDRLMSFYSRIYPEYGFLTHKGYPTKMHLQAIRRFGPSVIHRMSFCGVS